MCPVENQQIEVLLAEGNLVDGLCAVATLSRPSVESLRSVLEAAFNAPAASGIRCVLDISASHDSRCCIMFDTASRSCLPLHSAGHGCLVARIGHHVRGHRYCLWFRNRCVPQRRSCRDGMFIAFCAHFVVIFHRAQLGRRRVREIPLLSLHRPMRLSDTRRFALLSNRVPILRNRIKRACVFVKRINGKIHLNRVFRLRWLCKGRACRVQPFVLSLSVFL